MKNMKILFFVLVLSALIYCGCAKANEGELDSATLAERTKFFSPIVSGGWIVEHGKYLYYYDAAYLGMGDRTKLHRMNKNGENKVALTGTVSQDKLFRIQIYKNKLFHLRYTETNKPTQVKTTLYSYDIAKDKEVKLTDDKSVYNYAFQNDWIYFTTFGDTFKEGKLYKMKTDGTQESLIADLKCPMSLQIVGDRLYLGHDDTILIMNLDGSKRETINLKHYAFKVHGDNIYYIKGSDDIKSPGASYLWRYNLTSKKDDLLIDKAIKQFFIAKDKIYFYNYQHYLNQTDLSGENMRNLGPGSDPVVLSDILYYFTMEGRPNIEKLPPKPDAKGKPSSSLFPNAGGKVSSKPGQTPDTRHTFSDYYNSCLASIHRFSRQVHDFCYVITKVLTGKPIFEQDTPDLALPIVIEGKDTPENIARQNAAGNKLAGGYIVEKDGLLYFANPEDGNKLYRMDKNGENKAKLGDRENLHNLQFYGNKLFYLESKLYDTPSMNTLYSYDLNTKKEKKLTNYKNIKVEDYVLEGDWVYFAANNMHSDLGIGMLYKIKPDGKGRKLIDELYISPDYIQIFGDKLFLFSGLDFMLTMNFDGSDKRKRKASERIQHYLPLVYGDNIYYKRDISPDAGLHVGNLDNPFEKTKQLTSERLESYNIVDNKLYYCGVYKKDGKYRYEIYKADLDGKNAQFVANGCKPIILNDVMYYYHGPVYDSKKRKLLWKELSLSN